MGDTGQSYIFANQKTNIFEAFFSHIGCMHIEYTESPRLDKEERAHAIICQSVKLRSGIT